jgi:hypothetical protein
VRTQNPEIPDWLRDDIFSPSKELAQIGTEDSLSAEEGDTKRAILSVIAIARGLRTRGKFFISYSEVERLEMKP